MDLEQMKEEMRKAFDSMKAVGGNIEKEEEKEEAERDEDKLKELQETYSKKRSAWEASKAKVQKAMKVLEDEKLQGELEGQIDKSLSVDTMGKTFGDGTKRPAEPKDWAKQYQDHTAIFNKYLQVSRTGLSGEENKLITPRSDSFREGTKGAVAPPHIVAQLMGPSWMHQMGMSKELAYLTKGSSTMVSSSNVLGGYTVPEDFRLPVIELPGEEPFILPRTTVIPAPTGTVTMPRATQTDSDEYGGFAGDWIDEGGLKNKTDTRFEQVQINTHEYAAYTQISVRLLERSAIAMESYISRKARAKIMNELNRVFLRGSGSGQPAGIINTAGIHSVARETADQVSREDLVDLKRALQPYHRSGGIFILHDDVGGYLEKLTVSTTDKRPLFSASMANGPYDRLMGYPYIESTQPPALGNNGDAIFVDLREYYVAMESEVVIKRSDDYDIVHNLATIVVYVVVGGQLVEPRVAAKLVGTAGS